MSSQNSDFYNRLFELNNWQIQQQKKLRAFQEAQKKLLDAEHQIVLSNLAIPNGGKQSHKTEKNERDEELNECMSKNFLNCESSQNIKTSDAFIDYNAFKLNEPQHLKLNDYNQLLECNMKNDYDNDFDRGDTLKENKQKSKNYLKKGDGLARFRMTLEDFKIPPKIYKDKNIKTHFPSRQKNSAQNINSKKTKHLRSKSAPTKVPLNIPKKVQPFPVNIYLPEPKIKKQPTVNFNQKQNRLKLDVNCEKIKKSPISLEKLPLKNLTACMEECDFKNKPETDNLGKKDLFLVKDYEIESCNEGELERKQDENELKIFEMLEKKVDESSFCSNSSYIDKLMEIHITSSPPLKEKKLEKNYSKGLKSLQSQFLNEEQIKRFGKLDHLCDAESSDDNEEDFENEKIPRLELMDNIERDKDERSKDNINKKEETVDEVMELKENVKSNKNESEATNSRIVSKTLLQEYVKNFKNLKLNCKENFTEVKETENSPEKPKVNEPKVMQNEIALKLKRKGLQDNVKQLMNWENPSRKKTIKRLAKKIKPKPGKLEKAKNATNDISSKTVFSSSLLKERLDELEKEINIFKKENSKIERMQKDCEEERLKLNKDKKEFEKYMEEEKKKLEVQIAEGNKKLQKERLVFEKYCKQVKNQPTRQEREEISQLKKEVQKLTESMATKESRWGAAQARLRNQLRQLERENHKLKTENEKLQKMCSKKVTFGNDTNIESKIIRAINSELGKLKPSLMKTAPTNSSIKRQPLSARLNRNIEEKPLRRINSAPNMKRNVEHVVCEDVCSEWDDKPLGSISTDSGIEATLSRSTIQPINNKNKKGNNSTCNESSYSSLSKEEPDLVGEECCENLRYNPGQKSFTLNDDITTVVQNTIFGENDFEQSTLNKSKSTKCLEEPQLKKFSKDVIEAYPYFSKCASDEEKENFDLVRACNRKGEEKENETEESEFFGNKEKIETQCRDKLYSFHNSDYAIETRLRESDIRERIFEDGTKEIYYPNGNIKKILPGNKIIKIIYYNGDIKETNLEDGSEKYFYSETKTWHTTYKDGLEVLEFSNGQTERRHSNGIIEISFPNGCVRYCDAFGRDEWRFPDNTVIKTDEKGHKILLMPNGQKEVHTKEFKQREYPDGTVKILYSDGTQETRYASGRVRLKDKAGNLIMDSGGM